MEIPKLLLATVVAVVCLSTAWPAAAQTQGDLNRETCDPAAKVEQQLADVYAQVLRRAEQQGRQIALKVKAAQTAWQSFRDAELIARYPSDAPDAYGSVHPMCLCLVREELAAARVTQLRLLLDHAEGDVCNSHL